MAEGRLGRTKEYSVSARHSHCRGQGFDSPMLHQSGTVRTVPSECQKSGGAGGTASCRGYRGRAPNPCAAALSPQTSAALFAGNGGQLGVFRQTAGTVRTVPFLLPKKEYSGLFRECQEQAGEKSGKPVKPAPAHKAGAGSLSKKIPRWPPTPANSGQLGVFDRLNKFFFAGLCWVYLSLL